ncbi:MAG: preprotein translocase subunit SecE [Deltaproteobacteria bacterium]|nr:preprotein translocase subunit SecE [Deltaproteobacteria bacterium]
MVKKAKKKGKAAKPAAGRGLGTPQPPATGPSVARLRPPGSDDEPEPAPGPGLLGRRLLVPAAGPTGEAEAARPGAGPVEEAGGEAPREAEEAENTAGPAEAAAEDEARAEAEAVAGAQSPEGADAAGAGAAQGEEEEEAEGDKDDADEDVATQLGETRYVVAGFFAAWLVGAYVAGMALTGVWAKVAAQDWFARALPAVAAVPHEGAMVSRSSISFVLGGLIAGGVVLHYYFRPDIRTWTEEVAEQLGKVKWPTRKEVGSNTVVVLATSAVLTAYLTILDRLWGFLTNLVYTGGL